MSQPNETRQGGSPIAISARDRRRSFAAVIASMAVVTMTFVVAAPLLALVLERQGVSNTLIGLNTAMQAFASLASAPLVPRLMARFGPGPLMIAGLGVTFAALLLLPVHPNVWLWFPLRAMMGVGAGILWICSETWINQIAEEERRGRLVALYGIAGSVGMAFGAFVLSAIGSAGWAPFLALAAMTALAAVPIVAARKVSPRLEGDVRRALAPLLLLAPTALFLNLIYAATFEQLWAFLPVYGLALGMAEATPLRLLAAMSIGSILLQYPMGWLSDHMNRRLMLVLVVLLMIAAMAAVPLLMTLAYWNVAFFFLFGGVTGPLYNLGMVLLGERFRGAELARVTTLFGMMWSVGGFLGPPLAGVAMDAVGPHGLPLTIALMFVLYLPLPVASYLRARR